MGKLSVINTRAMQTYSFIGYPGFDCAIYIFS